MTYDVINQGFFYGCIRQFRSNRMPERMEVEHLIVTRNRTDFLPKVLKPFRVGIELGIGIADFISKLF